MAILENIRFFYYSFALLGPSGCGKTTLLKVVIDLIKPDSGEVKVFGEHLGTRNSHIPGRNVGYMPQEICLLDYFSIKEHAYYFGKINGMKSDDIQKNLTNLIDMLELPDEDTMICDLSGGQQRNVSFIVSVIHRPKLLILDEPTVGLDPILREKMWSFLEEVNQSTKTTIIITTHYIEEAIKANEVGLMRQGEILTIDAPRNIMNNLQTDTLEEAFVNVCNKENNYYETNFPKSENDDSINERFVFENNSTSDKKSSFMKIKMINDKNLKSICRHPMYV
jgi:ABC-type multidrug transport system ATPase subunit